MCQLWSLKPSWSNEYLSCDSFISHIALVSSSLYIYTEKSSQFPLSIISVFRAFAEGFNPLLVRSLSSARESLEAGDPCEL